SRDLHLVGAAGRGAPDQRRGARRRAGARDRVGAEPPRVTPLVVLDVVGLTRAQVGDETPHLSALAREGFTTPVGAVLPAVTSSAQATMLTGTMPREHGIVGNGWYFRELCEVWLWRQSNRLVAGEKVWEAARRRMPDFTCAKLFWWFNMHSSADW